ncbi:MAG: acyl-CoA dehydrogenase family protein [Candidatus Binatus sp.]|uniref:acyl-CoA dehydrogenase family protein n=1 Tax=Candidatus Binatus sp. TaxID=2811406 RepID=UPI00271896FE|nr:acyl-CoA dehydrogenase family protein [Candidatus Binatus sp.]MDO8433774.1 acyl-CoA dehydrogenase family protein [Candidatus Binatus sp.]
MIDFELSEEQQMIRDSVGGFAREEIRAAARPADESGIIPPELVAKAWQFGLVSGAIPEQFGGGGDARSAVTGAIVAEELAFGDFAIALHVLAPRLFAFPILEMGTDEQRAKFLKHFCGADFAAATAAIMEPRFDFDLTAMQTIAKRDGAGFILDGIKCNVPLASESNNILVYAATDAGKGFAGVDAFIINRNARDAPGVTISEREKNMGLKALATYELTLNDCRVDADARLGGDKGIDFSRLMSESRVAFAAMGVGVANAAYEYARDYAKERKAFGVPIATKQAIAFILADMAIEIDASRLLIWEAAAKLDKGGDALKESYLAKNYVAASALKITDNAVQVLGGHGYIREHPVEMWLRNARGLAAIDGIATV